jgi:ankyrin repeat protein
LDLLRVVYEQSEGGSLCGLRALCDAGVDLDEPDGHGRSALFLCAWYGHHEIVEWLLSKNPMVDRASNDGLTPLMMAVRQKHAACVEALLRAGADPRVKSRVGKHALSIAKDSAIRQIVHKAFWQLVRSSGTA